MATPTQHDRLRGCIVGGALGDAIGLFTEFFTAERSVEIYGQEPRFTLINDATTSGSSTQSRSRWKTWLTLKGDSSSPSQAATTSGGGTENGSLWTKCYMDRHRARFELSGWTDDTDQALLTLLGFLRSFPSASKWVFLFFLRNTDVNGYQVARPRLSWIRMISPGE
jgi:ADP-ribosylglycohydrolase